MAGLAGEHFWLLDLIGAFSFLNERLAPDWQAAETMIADLAIADLKLEPRVQWVTFSSPDGYHHLYGTTDAYRDIVANLDAQLGRYLEAATARPGPSAAAALTDWFWRETAAGALLLRVASACVDSDAAALKALGEKSLVPRSHADLIA